jgi:hypothetical protein
MELGATTLRLPIHCGAEVVTFFLAVNIKAHTAVPVKKLMFRYLPISAELPPFWRTAVSSSSGSSIGLHDP